MVFPNIKNPIFITLDDLYCDEEALGEKFEKCEENLEKKGLTLMENDLFWEDDEVVRLLSKEKENYLCCNNLDSDELLMVDRKDGVEWILMVVGHYGFTALTGVLAVNYYDTFMSTTYFHKNKPWMSQLVAVASLSIAAKMEEIQVPLLLDLQVENSKFVFEAKTIMRMEILLLCNLKWKTNFVTPISFFDHIVRRFKLQCGFLRRCESILLETIIDSRLMHYLPSVIATATTLFVMEEIDPCNTMDYRNQLYTVMNICKGKVDECYQVIIERMDDHHGLRKRKIDLLVPSSPNGVIDGYLNSDNSSNESSSPQRVFKKSRAQDQTMRLLPLSKHFG